MRALVPIHRISSPANAEGLRNQTDATGRFLAPLLDLAENSDYLVAGSVGAFIADGELFRIPRALFMGPKGGGDTIRVAIFAAIHGNEIEGTEALIELLHELSRTPAVAKGYHIYAYPVCNPSGLAAGTRNNVSGVDLTGEFWRRSDQPEVYYLEREMGVHQFQGVISLHNTDGTDFGAQTRSSILDEALVQPALRAARQFLSEPDSQENAISWPHASHSMPAGFLTATDELLHTPFEINFGIPVRAPKLSRIQGTAVALMTILESYRILQATRQNI